MPEILLPKFFCFVNLEFLILLLIGDVGTVAVVAVDLLHELGDLLDALVSGECLVLAGRDVGEVEAGGLESAGKQGFSLLLVLLGDDSGGTDVAKRHGIGVE